jgi:hypothetical protein
VDVAKALFFMSDATENKKINTNLSFHLHFTNMLCKFKCQYPFSKIISALIAWFLFL